MAEDAENTCCTAWKKKHFKLLEKYSKIEELKNKFRDCTSLVNQQYDVIEKENGSLKQQLGNLKAQADRWKDEKEQEYSMRVDLETEISALKKEIQLLQQNGKAASIESGRQLQERLDVAELEINQLKEFLEKERHRADLEKMNADMQRKKAEEALEKLEAGKNKVSEAQKAVDIEMKKAEENKVLYERLKSENAAVKSKLCLERSKSEVANKKVEDEKQHTIKERKMADLAVFKAEEQQKLAETNLKKAIVEKDRADNLDQKLKEEKRRTENLEKELQEYICSRKLAETRVGLSNASIESVLLRNDIGTRMAKSKALTSQGIEKMVKEKDQFNFKEKKHADSEVEKVAKHKKVAEAHKRKAVEEQYHVEQLSRELEDCKQRLEELQERQQTSCRTHVVNQAVGENSNSSDRATVKQLKKQKKLEKMLVKHAKEVTKADVRNSWLHQELFHIKKRFHQFQQRLDLLDVCFVRGGDIIHELEKAGDETLMKEKFYTDGYEYLKKLVSGTDSRLDPRYRGSYRKMSKSSALNYSTASFSDLPLMGSQERGAFSVTTSAKPGEDISNLKSSLSKLSCEGTVRHRESVVTNAEKSTKSPIKGNADNSRIRHWDKRKILGAVESMDKLYSKDQKLHEQMSKQLSVLRDILSDHKDDSALENFCAEQARPTKRRKTSCEGTKIINSLHKSNRRKGMLDSDINNSNVGRKASSPGLDVRKGDQYLKDGIDNCLESTKCAHRDFDASPIHDYMKLLELDNSADERSYRIAISTPISPTLPEIKFLGGEAIDSDDVDMPITDNLAPASGFNTFGMGKNCKHPENLGVEHESGACNYHNKVLGGKLGIPNVNGSKSEKTHLSCERGIASIPDAIPNYFVFSLENKDNGSISRILLAIVRCKPQCTPFHSADVSLQRILLSLKKDEDLSSEEKVCVFFSIIMLGISEIEMKNMANFLKCDLVQSLDSVTLHICSALSDLVVRGIFMESCDLFDLLALIEDFLLQRKVLVCVDLSSEAPVLGSSKIKLVVNGSTVILSEQAALTYQLVAGGCLLASLCLAVDHIDFVCATSCELFALPKFDPAMVLAILHSFAHLCGSKYFTLQPYSLAMTVTKSLVMVLEKQASSSNYASTFSSMVEMPSKTWSCCTNCLFSEGVVSMEVLASLLLENLQKYSKSCSFPVDSLELMNSFVPIMLSNEEITKEVSGLRQAVVSLTATSNESLCNFVDILSLVEIVAHFMKWEWTFDNIIGGLLEILESCAIESFYAAIIVLLNQLGRLGVDSNGYEDAGIKKLRFYLFAFFHQSTSRNLSILVQFAAVTALIGLIPVSFEELFTIESQSILNQESIPADFIRKWFSLLSKEQQLSFRLHQSTGKTNSYNRVSAQSSVLRRFDLTPC